MKYCGQSEILGREVRKASVRRGLLNKDLKRKRLLQADQDE